MLFGVLMLPGSRQMRDLCTLFLDLFNVIFTCVCNIIIIEIMGTSWTWTEAIKIHVHGDTHLIEFMCGYSECSFYKRYMYVNIVHA